MKCAWSAKPASHATSTSGAPAWIRSPREVETAHQQIAVRARAEHRPELAGQVVARQSRDRLQLRRVHDAGALRVEELRGRARPHGVDPWRGAAGPPPPGSAASEALGQVDDEAVHRQRLQGRAGSAASTARASCRSVRHGLAHERQRRRPSAEHAQGLTEAGRLHVDDPIAESLPRARPPSCVSSG